MLDNASHVATARFALYLHRQRRRVSIATTLDPSLSFCQKSESHCIRLFPRRVIAVEPILPARKQSMLTLLTTGLAFSATKHRIV